MINGEFGFPGILFIAFTMFYHVIKCQNLIHVNFFRFDLSHIRLQTRVDLYLNHGYIDFSLTANKCSDDDHDYMGKQPVAWKEYYTKHP